MIGSKAGLTSSPRPLNFRIGPQQGHAAGVGPGTSRWKLAVSASWLLLTSLLAHSQAGADVYYRGWLQSERDLLAVLTQDGRDRVVAVGDACGPEWRVISIDAASVVLQNTAKTLKQQVWFGGGSSLSSSDGSSSIGRAQLRWNAPPVVEPGSTFSVVLLAPGLDLGGGEFTLDYDPKVLAITDAIGGEEDYGGRARLPVREGGGDYLAEVTFHVIAHRPVTTRLRIDNVVLVGREGESLSPVRGSDLMIQVVARPDPSPHAQTRK